MATSLGRHAQHALSALPHTPSTKPAHMQVGAAQPARARLCPKWCMRRPKLRPRSCVPRVAAHTADSRSLNTRQKMMKMMTGMPSAKAVRHTPSSLRAKKKGIA